MGKRLLVVVTLLLVTGIFAGWYFFARESRYFGTSPLKAIPVDSPLFFRIRNLGKFTEKTVNNSCWQSMIQLDRISSIYEDIVFLDSLLHQNRAGNGTLENKEMYIVKTENARLYLLEIVSIAEKNRISALIRNHFQAKNIRPTNEKYLEASLQKYAWKWRHEDKEINLTFYRGVLMASNQLSLLRKAIDQMDQASLLEDADFLSVNKNTAENNDVNIFIHRKSFTPLLTHLFTDSLVVGNLQPGYAKWTEVDVIQKEDKLIFNAFTHRDSTLSSYQDIFRRQKPLAGSLVGYMPSTTTFFVSQNLSDLRYYFEDYASYLHKNGKIGDYNLLVAGFSRELNFNVSQYLKNNWTGEAAAVFTNQNLENDSDNQFLLLKVKRGSDDPMVVAMKRWASGKSNMKDPESMEAAKLNIWKVPRDNFGKLTGDLYFGSVKTNWITAGEGFILMGATPGSLKRYLNLLWRGDILSGNLSYSKYATGLANSYNFYLWSAPGHAMPFFERIFTPEILRQIGSGGQNLKKVENISWQWANENGMVYNSASLGVNPNADQTQQPFWRFPLKLKIGNNPHFVAFSRKNRLKELVFQDGENNLINLNKDGTEQWRVPLEGAIIGEIKTVELHNNGEFQLLFNTGQAIHLISKNGAEVRNFPLRLASPATNSVAVFDYENKKDYRFLVACSDHVVYNFDKYGKITQGWKPKATTGIVEFPVHHFRVNAKDYIVFFDKSRTYILDRQGKERVALKTDFEHSANDIVLIKVKGSSDCMATTDKQGNIRLIGFDSSNKKLTFGKYSSLHYFLAVDFNDKGNSDFLICDKQKLYRIDQSGRVIFAVDLTISVDQAPSLFYDGKERLIVLNSNAENRSILVRKDGSIYNTFQTPFKLMAVGSFDDRYNIENWITWSADGFLSNYQMIYK